MVVMAGGMRSSSGSFGTGESGESASTIFQRNGVSLAAAIAEPNLVAASAAAYVLLAKKLARRHR